MREVKNLDLKVFLWVVISIGLCSDAFTQNTIVEKDTLDFNSLLPSFSKIQNSNLSYGFNNNAILHPNSLPYNSAFFCKLEKKWSGNSKWGIRMRLGSLDYVNGLEKKK